MPLATSAAARNRKLPRRPVSCVGNIAQKTFATLHAHGSDAPDPGAAPGGETLDKRVTFMGVPGFVALCKPPFTFTVAGS